MSLILSLADKLLSAYLDWLADQLRPRLHTPPRPDPFTLSAVQEITPVGIEFKVVATLPVLANPDPNDVASQELAVTVDGVARPATAPPLDAGTSDLGTFPLGAKIEASLTYLDASGNRSPARVESITVSDTVAPAQPGEFGLSVEQV